MDQPVHWDDRFVGLAAHIASWSKDPSTKCGAVVVRPDKTIASLGFNGFPREIPDVGLLNRQGKYERIIHAEMNALLFLGEAVPVLPPGHTPYTIYTWPFGPCCRCAVHIIQSGIKRVVAPDGAPQRWEESLEISRELFNEAGVEFVEKTG